VFIGHFGVGLGAKKVAPRISLGTLFLAAQFLDLVWPLFLLLGIERVTIDPGNTAVTPLNFVYYPYSHSLGAVVIWGGLFGLIYFFIRRNLRQSLILGILVVSHWLLDLIAHRPDLPLLPWGDTMVGFGLWNSVVLTVVVEGAIFAAGAIIYLRTTRALNRKGSVGLWSLILFLVLVYTMNLFGPPPDSITPLAWVGLSQWLLVAWAYGIDRNRTVRQ